MDIEKPGQCLDTPMQGEHVIGFNQFYKLTAQVPPERLFLPPPAPFFKEDLNEEKAAAFWKGNPFLAFPLPMSSAFMMARESCVWIYKKRKVHPYCSP